MDDFPGLLGLASFGAPATVDEQDMDSIAMQLTEWGARLLTSGNDRDLCRFGQAPSDGEPRKYVQEWLQEGIALLSKSLEDALMDFVSQQLVAAQLHKFSKLANDTMIKITTLEDTAAVSCTINKISADVDSLLPEMESIVSSLAVGSEACKQPIALLEQVQGVLSSLASLDPEALVMGRIEKLLDMAQAHIHRTLVSI